MSATAADTRSRITPEQIRREVLEILGGAPVDVRVSILVVPSRHTSGGALAKLSIDVNDGARRFDLTLMLERLYLPLEEFSETVLAPMFPAAQSPGFLNQRGNDDG